MNDGRKVLALILYLWLTICTSASRFYVKTQRDLYLDESMMTDLKLYGQVVCALPLLCYKLNFRTKWFSYIFLQLFGLIYVYVFASRNIFSFHESIIDSSDIILRYYFYWRFILSNTIEKNEIKFLHAYASISYFAYYADKQIFKLFKKLDLEENADIIFYICCSIYFIIGTVIYRYYKNEDKHLLMHDEVSRSRSMIQSLIAYCSYCSFLGITREYNDYIGQRNLVTLIGSCVVLTITGKLLHFCSYKQLLHFPAIVNGSVYIILSCYTGEYKTHMIQIAMTLIICTKYLTYDTIHNILYIPHKKKIIDRYISNEIMAMSIAYITIHFYPTNENIILISICSFMQLILERYALKYFEKDQEYLGCIYELDTF